MIPKCIKRKQIENNVQDLQTKYNSFLKPMKLDFGSSSQLTKTFNLTGKGSAFISYIPNGYSDGEAYILYFKDKDTLAKTHKLIGDTNTLTFSISNGVLSITSSVQWSTGFIIFNS